MKNKKAIEMSFNWIFALIAGGFILFIAIYGAVKFIDTGGKAVSTETAAKVISLLDPFETGLASGKFSEIAFKKKSRIYFTCSVFDNMPFGQETIAFSEQSVGDKYGVRSERVPVKNKYIFAENPIEGRKINIFSIPFFMPFKIADLIIMYSEGYCFYEPPNKIKEDLGELGIKNIVFAEGSFENCTGMKIVCFDSRKGNCDIDVVSNRGDFNSGRVVKEYGEVYFEDNLLYAAIFSNLEIYECNLKRLLNKFNELSLIYIDKISIIQKKGCSSSIDNKLRIIMDSIRGYDNSYDLQEFFEESKEIDLINKGASLGCRLY